MAEVDPLKVFVTGLPHTIAKNQPSFPKLSEKDWAKVKSLATIGMPSEHKLDIDSYLIGLRQ